MQRDGKYLITGGTGTIGRGLVTKLLHDGFTGLSILARNEGKIIEMEDYPIKVITGDIADPCVCDRACLGIDGIIHLAAFKHVRLAEDNVYACVKTNITGLVNMLNQTVKHKPKFFLFATTDKALNIKGVYSATKYLGEKLVQEYAKFNPATEYKTVRFGNVGNSTGSFLDKWQHVRLTGDKIVLMDPKATRFLSTVEEAVEEIKDCIGIGKHIKRKIKAISIGKALEAFHDKYGKGPVKVVGLQKCENLHEKLGKNLVSNKVKQYTKEEFTELFL